MEPQNKNRKQIIDFYASAAKRILKDFDLSKILERSDQSDRELARFNVPDHAVEDVLEGYLHYIPELAPDWASGTEYVHNLHAFTPAFSSALRVSLTTILTDLVSASDLEQIKQAVESAAKEAPQFEPSKGRLRFHPLSPKGSTRERKAIVRERCDEAKKLCERRGNEHPDLKALVDKYDDALSKLKGAQGAYRLFMAGLDIEVLLKVKSSLPRNDDSNPEIDVALLQALSSLITAHAGLLMLFPDAANFAHELDQYRRQSETIDALRDRILDPVLEKLAEAPALFDPDTEHLTRLVSKLGARTEEAGLPPTANVTAVKHGWLRGSLAAIARVVLKKGPEFAKVIRDGVLGNAAYELLKQPETLVTGISLFLINAQQALLQLAERLPAAFGWLRQLLHLMGL